MRTQPQSLIDSFDNTPKDGVWYLMGSNINAENIDIKPTDTAGTLSHKLSILGAELLIPTLKKYIAGKIKPQPQNNKKASYIKKLKKQDGHINWTKSAQVIERLIRAMTPWPSAYAYILDSRPAVATSVAKAMDVKKAMAGKRQIADNRLMFKIIEVEHKPVKINKYKIGELFLYNQKLAVQCGQNALVIKKVQLEGKKEMTAEEFIHGHKNLINTILY